MILYATNQTIKELNLPIANIENKAANKIIEEQTNDSLLEWGIKLFYFNKIKCLQAVNFSSKLTIFLFDVRNEEIEYIGNAIATYLMEIYSNDAKMKKVLMKFFNDYPSSTFAKLTNKSVTAILNNNQHHYAEDGKKFYDYVENNVLNSMQINKDYNWKQLTTKNIEGRSNYTFPAEYFKELILERYSNKEIN